MRLSAKAEQDPAVTVAPSVPWRIKAVSVLPGYRLHVAFLDGLEGIVDMSALIHSPQAGVFAGLADPVLFAQATVCFGAVIWPGEIDLAPDAMYQEIKQHGHWTLE